MSAAGPPPVADAQSEGTRGVLYAGGAFAFWGFVPIYWKTVRDVGSLELLAHRVLWALPFLALYLLLRGRLGELTAPFRDRRTLATLGATTVLIAVNWLLFIVAVNSDHVLQASLGYYINPLVNVFFGLVVLGERLRRNQWLAIGLAALGVAILTLRIGEPPWLALVLAGSFGLYGLFRKTVRAEPVSGLAFEVAALFPLALGYVLVLGARAELAFGTADLGTRALIACAGPITVLPLVWFTNGARRIRLSTVGILQYLAPTGHFLLAVLAYGEPFSGWHLASFALIWTALAVYTVDSVRTSRRRPLRTATR